MRKQILILFYQIPIWRWINGKWWNTHHFYVVSLHETGCFMHITNLMKTSQPQIPILSGQILLSAILAHTFRLRFQCFHYWPSAFILTKCEFIYVLGPNTNQILYLIEKSSMTMKNNVCMLPPGVTLWHFVKTFLLFIYSRPNMKTKFALTPINIHYTISWLKY